VALLRKSAPPDLFIGICPYHQFIAAVALLDELWRGEHIARRTILVAQVAVAPLLAVNAKLASQRVDRSPPPF
jgi:hypothetical protein